MIRRMKRRIKIQSKKHLNAGLIIVAIWALAAAILGLTFSNSNLALLSLPFLIGWVIVSWSLLSDENSMIAKLVSVIVLTGIFTWLSIILTSAISIIFHGIAL